VRVWVSEERDVANSAEGSIIPFGGRESGYLRELNWEMKEQPTTAMVGGGEIPGPMRLLRKSVLFKRNKARFGVNLPAKGDREKWLKREEKIFVGLENRQRQANIA